MLSASSNVTKTVDIDLQQMSGTFWLFFVCHL